MSFDDKTRKTLSKTVADCRRLLTDDVTDQLEGTFGLYHDGTMLPPERLTHLNPGQTASARALRDLLDHYTVLATGDEDKRRKAAFERLVLEISFTVLNRLAALRLCEERGLIVECVRKGTASDGFRMYESLAGGALGSRYDTYRTFLECMFDELAVDLGVLFDRTTPTSTIFPSESCLKDVLDLLNAGNIAPLWKEDETIGWIYQYFNPKEERDEMRKANRSPRNTRELAVRNQFFTPRYVVEFLTDNTLGRIWYDMRKGDTRLTEDCRYLVRRPNETFLQPGESSPETKTGNEDPSQEELLQQPVFIEHRPKKDPRDLTVLDPACGSGHFLLYAFDLLETIYLEAWEDPDSPPSEATGTTLRDNYPSVENLRHATPELVIRWNLHGIDIDPRAVQIAALALWLRAQRAWQAQELASAERPRIMKSNIVSAEPMPGEIDLLREFTATLQPKVLGQLVEVVFDQMKLAGEAGSLLKVEEEIRYIVAEAKKQWLAGPQTEQTTLFGTAVPRQTSLRRFSVKDIPDEYFWDQAEELILAALRDYAERAEYGHVLKRRLFAEDTAKGFAFIDICRKRFEVVLMNPPFGATGLNSKIYIENRYPRTKGEILTNFIERAEILITENGMIGTISSRTPFFLGSSDEFRAHILGKKYNIETFADLGEGVLEAMVETAIYTIKKAFKIKNRSIFFRLLLASNKASLLEEEIKKINMATSSTNRFLIDTQEFSRLPGSPYAYWISTNTIQVLGQHPRLVDNAAEVHQGLITSDDYRFLRLLWEVPPEQIVPKSRREERDTIPIHSRCINELYQGGQWVPFSKTDIASPLFSPITLVVNWKNDGKEIKNFFDKKGKLRSRPQSGSYYFHPGIGYMLRSTRLVPFIVPSGVIPPGGRSQIFPHNKDLYSIMSVCASNIGSAVAIFNGEKFAWPKFQVGMIEKLPDCDFNESLIVQVKNTIEDKVSKKRMAVQGFEPYQEFVLPAWTRSTNPRTEWSLYSLLGDDLEKKIAFCYGLTIDQLKELERDIFEAVTFRNGTTSFIENANDDSSDIEETVLEVVEQTVYEKAIGLLFYTIGCLFGRWDIRIATDPSLAPKLPDPFDPLPVCPPGMLVGPDGLSAVSGRIVSEEWLKARPDAITLPPEGSVGKPTIADDEYPIRISWDGILVDDPGFGGISPHRDDVVRRVREVLDSIWGDRVTEIEHETSDILGISDLRDYFRRPSGFFQDHLKRYSKSRRKAPIYWPLSTASGSYTILLYYHRLTDQTIYTVLNRYLEPKIAEVERGIARIETDLETTTGREATELRDRAAGARTFLGELRDLRDELIRIAELPYRPDLNDGVIINAAPFHNLFRHSSWAKDTKETWRKLEKGDYDWAHMAFVVWPDRVRKACRKDRSTAIAHGLEELCEIEERPAAKKRGGRRKTKETEL